MINKQYTILLAHSIIHNLPRMKPIAISFDIDGTLGKQTSQINEKNHSSMEYAHRIPIEGDRFGDFVFFKGIINLLHKIHLLTKKYKNIHIMLNTSGYRTPECPNDRNQLIQNYINDCLVRYTNPIPLYDVRYQTFNKSDILLAQEGKIDSKEWQEWFNDLFKLHHPNKLYIVDKQDTFDHYFYRDHQVILDKHLTLYEGLTLDNILHIDDSPRSIVTFHPTEKVHLIKVDRDHPDKEKECSEIFLKIEKFILSKCEV